MATFPSGIVTFTNPSSSTLMSVVSHAGEHTSENNEIVAIETALGINLANVVQASALSASSTLAENSDSKVATQKAVKSYADAMVLTGGGIPIGYLDTDGTMAANSDTKVASQKAIRTYIAALPVAASITRGTFGNADLSTGVLTITHNKALASPYTVTVSLFNNSGVFIIPDQINTLTTNSFKIDLTSYGTLSGSWSYAYST